MNLIDTFCVGMDRRLQEFLEPPEGPRIQLGGGNKVLDGAKSLDRDWGWIAPDLPFGNGSIAAVYAFHFMEHLDGNTAVHMLHEIQRVLMPGGIFNSVIPFWDSELAHQDLDHKSFWSERTWENLFNNPYYVKGRQDWSLRVHSCVIMGLVQRNLVIVTQLVKENNVPVSAPTKKAKFEAHVITTGASGTGVNVGEPRTIVR